MVILRRRRRRRILLYYKFINATMRTGILYGSEYRTVDKKYSEDINTGNRKYIMRIDRMCEKS